MELTLNISAIVAIIGALTVLTNIIVEVLKRATWEKMPTNLLAIIVAMVLTLVAFFGYMAFMGYAVMWYYVANRSKTPGHTICSWHTSLKRKASSVRSCSPRIRPAIRQARRVRRKSSELYSSRMG